jgi:hypothetical protein
VRHYGVKEKTVFVRQRFLEKHGFMAVDTIEGDYILSVLSFDGTKPRFAEMQESKALRIRS